MTSQESMQPVLLLSVPDSAQEYRYQPRDAGFLIDLTALLMEMDPRTSDPSTVHHSVAKQSLDNILVNIFKDLPAVLELMETMVSNKKKEMMLYRLAGCVQLLIAVTSPPRTGAAPSVLVVVYKAICRGLFEILSVVFNVDTGCILNLMRSRSANKREKVKALIKYFHVENGPYVREILLLFQRLVKYEKEKMEEIVNWIITVMYVDHMAPLFDSKYPGIIRAEKYYKMRAKGRPCMSNQDALSVEFLLQHMNVHFRNTPNGNFDPAWILYKFKVSPDVAIAVTTKVLEYAYENDAKMDFQGDSSRKYKWEYGLQTFNKDTDFIISLLHKEMDLKEKTTLSTCPVVEVHPLTTSSKMVDVSGLLKPSTFYELSVDDQKIVLASPCHDLFRKIMTDNRVRIDNHHQRLLIACILGNFEEKDGYNQSKKISLKNSLLSTRHHTTHSDGSGVVCPRGTMCLIHGFIYDGIRRVQETCYDPRHTYIISNTLLKWIHLARYYSIIDESTVEKRQIQKETRDKKKQAPPLIVPAWFIPSELWMKCGDKIDQNLEFNDNDLNSVGKDPMGQENSQLLQLWYLQQRVGTKMLNRWKSRVSNKIDFKEFRDIVFDSDKFESLRRDLHCTENTFRQFGVYLAWFYELLKVGHDRKVNVGSQSVNVDPLSIAFVKGMKPYLEIVEWAVARRTLLPVFTYLDKNTDKYVCKGRFLTRVEIHQLQEYIDLSRIMCEYMPEEDRVLTYGREITYECYPLRIKEEEDKKLPRDLTSGQRAHNRFLEGKANNRGTDLKQHLLSVMNKQSSLCMQRRRSPASNKNFKWDNNHSLVRKTRDIMELQRAENERYLKDQEDAEVESEKQEDNQQTTRPLTIVISKSSSPMENEQLCNPTVLTEHQNSLISQSGPVHPVQRIEDLVQKELKVSKLIQQQNILFLGHMFPAPGFLFINGPDFIIRDMSEFKVPSTKMLLLLVNGKPIKTGGIHIAWSGLNIHIDTTGSGMATYQIAGYAVRRFAAINYPALGEFCGHESQSWCYMKNGGNLCIRIHKHQDGGDLSF